MRSAHPLQFPRFGAVAPPAGCLRGCQRFATPFAPPLSDKTAAEITAAVNAFAPYVIVTDSAKLVLRALELLQAHSLQFYDALIVAGAESAGCTMLFSEDMTDGAAYGSVTIVNPFQRGR